MLLINMNVFIYSVTNHISKRRWNTKHRFWLLYTYGKRLISIRTFTFTLCFCFNYIFTFTLAKMEYLKENYSSQFFFFFCEVFSCLSMYVISTLAIKIISTLYPPKYLNRYKSHVLVFLIFGLFIFYDLGSYGIVN